VSAVNERRPRRDHTEGSNVRPNQQHQGSKKVDVALYRDGEHHLVIAGPKRGRPPMDVNGAIRGTAAVFDDNRRVWVIPLEDAAAVVANLRSRGCVVASKVVPWDEPRDYRSPDPLPECVHCATPYRRLGVVPRHCVKCGDRLELQVIRIVEDLHARPRATCACGASVDVTALFCGDCGSTVEHG
jgi:hypothetical protein